jgi:aspartate aminotransferase
MRTAIMPRSSIRRIFNAVVEVQMKGGTVIPLHIGDPDFDMPERIAQGITKALANKQTHYSPVPGIPPLRQAIARHMAAKLGLPLAKDLEPTDEALSWLHIACAQGATQGLHSNVLLCVNEGDEILFPQVHFPNCMQQCVLNGIVTRLYPMDERFQPKLDQLEDYVTDKTRAILINSPSNPTGAMFPPATIERMYDFAVKHNLWLISDEAYVDFVYRGEYLSPLQLDWKLPAEQRRVLGVFSFSKSYATTGLRMGWTVCPRLETAQQLALLNEPLTGSLTTPLQWGLVEALALDDTDERRASLAKRNDLAAGILCKHGFEVQPAAGGMFYFLDISRTGMGGDEFADKLLAEESVAVVPGSGFGLTPHIDAGGHWTFTSNDLASRCIRLCFGLPAELLTEGVERMGRFIARHSK